MQKIITWNTGSRYLELTSVFIAYFTSFFVLNSLNVAMPRIAADLNGMSIYAWAISIPALASAFVILIFGKLSDMYGRRILLLVSTGLVILGAILCAISQTFVLLIVALGILGMGQGAIPPLCFSVLGDLYAPAERGMWAGLLNISSGITAFIVPTLSGWLVDNMSWRYIFWLVVPLAILTGMVVLYGLPMLAKQEMHKIDIQGSIYLALATSTMILGFSWAGNTYAWVSVQIIGLLGISAIFWVLFLRVETKAPEPMLDLQVLTNRTFIIASMSALMSFFGLTAIMVYYPLYLQGVQSHSATLSGNVITPLSVLMSLMGIPAGFLIAKTKRYKWMFVGGYAILTIVMFGMVALKADTAIGWGFVITTVAGIGLGAIPTVNALVVQYAVPKKLLGVATGGLYFFVMMGRSIAPAILGSAMNTVYAGVLTASLPVSLNQIVGDSALSSLSNPRVLLSESAIVELQGVFNEIGSQAPVPFEQMVQAIRSALEAGLHVIFLVGAITMLISFLLILAIPEISLDVDVQANGLDANE